MFLRSGVIAAVCAACCTVCWPTARASAADLRLWGGVTPPEGEVAAVSLEGVLLRTQIASANALETLIGLDRVQRLGGEHADAFAQYELAARTAWRARARLERGDAVGAEPLFEELFGLYRGRTGPTAAMVCEGLLRCRLRRGAYAQAIEAWVAWSEARQSGGLSWRGGSIASAQAVEDDSYGLVPALPPFWTDGPEARRLAATAGGSWASSADADRTQRLAALYGEAARRDLALPADPLPAPAAASDDGLRLVIDLVRARSTDAPTRAQARSSLQSRLSDDVPAWLEAWTRTGLGLSLLAEDDPRDRRLGVVQLLHVHVRLSDEQPYLGGLALARAAGSLARHGDDEGAAALLTDLLTSYPQHPVLREPRTAELLDRLVGATPGLAAAGPAPTPNANAPDQEDQ